MHIVSSLSCDFSTVINFRSGREAKFKVSLKDITWLGSKEVLKNQTSHVKRTQKSA